MTGWAAGRAVHDTLDLFNRQSIDGYMFNVGILYLARLASYRIGPVPVCWRDDGDSRLALVRGNMRNVRDISVSVSPMSSAQRCCLWHMSLV